MTQPVFLRSTSTAASSLSVAVCTLLITAALVLSGCDARTETTAAETPKPSQPVLVTTIRLEPLAPARALPGTIRARTETDLGFRIGGKILRRSVDAGAVVGPGQLLAEIDQADLALQVQQAEADLQSARTMRETAQAELSRTATLRRQGWSTAAEFDRQKGAADEAQGRAERAAHALTLARNALAYGELRADHAGVVTATPAEPGQVVAAGQTVIKLAQLDQKEAAVAIPEALLAEARTGQAEVTLWALPARSFPARLRELTPNADPVTRTYAARFALDDAGPEVMLGMTSTVTLTQDSSRAARLPLSAIFDQGEGPTVWVVDAEDIVRQRPISVARYGDRDAIVTSGLIDGDRVVKLGVQKLLAGQRVRPMDRLPS